MPPLPTPSPQKLPRWRGFNLTEKIDTDNEQPFRESDFAFLAEHGFNFARLPLSYLIWADPENPLTPIDDFLADIDRALDLGRQYSIHICLNFHRAPGYCVNPPGEALDLWNDPEAAEMFAAHWQHFAARYRAIPNTHLSFNLVNEPANIPEPAYARIIRQTVAAIREADPARLLIADGLRWGVLPCHSLADLGIAQSTRGYSPLLLTHYRAPWVPTATLWPRPRWPLVGPLPCDQARLKKVRIDPWKKLENPKLFSGRPRSTLPVGVHVGEFGAHNQTPHHVVLAWMRDFLELWQAADWGWALWNLRGSFGVLDSARADVTYETTHNHQLDRAMLELLKEF